VRHGCESDEVKGLPRGSFLPTKPKAFPKIWDALRWSFLPKGLEGPGRGCTATLITKDLFHGPRLQVKFSSSLRMPSTHLSANDCNRRWFYLRRSAFPFESITPVTRPIRNSALRFPRDRNLRDNETKFSRKWAPRDPTSVFY